MLPRQMTPDEVRQARVFFPQMQFQRVIVTDEMTRIYNCLAYALCASGWVWPWGDNEHVSKQQFDDLFRRYGYRPAVGASVPIGVTGNSVRDMLHGYRHLPSGIAMAESKLGKWLRIRHGIDDIMGGPYYGWHMGDYAPGHLDAITGETEETMKEIPKPPQEIIDAVRQKAAQVSPSDRSVFEKAWHAWEATWHAPEILISSSSRAFTRSPEYAELVKLGSPIIPLLMEKLLNSDDWAALLVVDRILPDDKLTIELDDPRILGGEQARALETIRKWL